ncbi:EamA family transporter [Gordonia sp. TBRC 11910]|uniref:EamA family transporter n=1 Tax=Gordonia asplenii TaxID=2725283 RepID=A0A848KYX4_9ACTN|nr:EamA family transporter [Gordonia asplenii]NMO01401.1 EamA family transporter [Gordonia asplenii]
MTSTALALILTAAVCHAMWNIAAKRVSSDGYTFVWWYTVGSAALWLPVGLVFLALDGWPWSWGLLYAPIVSAAIHIAYQLSLQTGYHRADLSVVYPVARGAGPLITMTVAILAMGERPGVAGIVGGLVIIAGIVIVASGSSPTHRARRVDGVLWGVLTGAAIASYTLWDEHAVTSLALLPVSYFAVATGWQSVFMTPYLLRKYRASIIPVLRRYWLEITAVAVLSPFAYVLVLQAMRTTPVALVAPVRESSIVVGSLLAWWMFKEPNPVRKMVGAVVVLAGIGLIVV